MTAAALLKESEVEEYINTHQGASEEITRAAKLLEDKPDALKALKKLLPALSQKTVSVFFSYKQKDEEAAQKVVNVLRRSSADKLEITYQADFTRDIVGGRWRDKISEEVSRANWFILLLPDPSDDWDWCLYETGLFEAQHTSADRLICLHHPDTKLPGPIEDYHAVSATLPEIEKFLQMAFIQENALYGMKPINSSIEPQIPELAREIVDAMRPPRKCLMREIYEPWVQLVINNAENLQSMDDLDSAIVKSANSMALDMFDFIKQPSTWGELWSGLPETNGADRWRNELFHVVRRIARGRKFYPVQAVFQTSNNRFYRPMACAVDRSGNNGPIEIYHITFAEEVGVGDSSAIPEEISSLAMIMRFTFRFRWEVLEKFGRGSMSENDVERLDNSLRRIKVDAESRGLKGRDSMDAIIKLFTPQQAERISKMYCDWFKVRNPDGQGELDLAIEHKEIEKIPELLSRFIPVNQEFLEIASDRFSELISNKM